MALGIMVVLGLMSVTAIEYTTRNSRASDQSKTKTGAFTLAEAGINNSMAVLNDPNVNSLDPTVLPTRTTTLGKGTVTWSGTLDRANAIWTLTSTGSMRNPNPNGGNVTKTLTAKVTVVPTVT
ncbi:MAG: hypothetical protein WBB74_11060, partial [Gaiellaceae bacterium]